jgi:hypothetical protein
LNRTNGRRFVALIGDIRGSRELDDRGQVQRDLETVLAETDDALDEALAAGFVVTTGDEFQALFEAPRVVDPMGWIAERLPELTLAYGIGFGGLDTELKPEAVGMDGPCFHRARHALNRAKDENRWAWAKATDAADADGDATTQLSRVLGAVGALRSDWTPTQACYAHALRHADTQRAVAARADKSPSTISESLKAAHHREVRELEAVAGDLLGDTLDTLREAQP